MPFFQTLLALDRVLDLIKFLIVDQSMNGVPLAKSTDRVRAMLIHATDKIIGHANVESPANFAGKDIDPVGTAHPHAAKLVVTGSPGQAGR
jgi:hypothetical protein